LGEGTHVTSDLKKMEYGIVNEITLLSFVEIMA
jgi:hypothetical protein